MVESVLSFWDGSFSGAILNFWGVFSYQGKSYWHLLRQTRNWAFHQKIVPTQGFESHHWGNFDGMSYGGAQIHEILCLRFLQPMTPFFGLKKCIDPQMDAWNILEYYMYYPLHISTFLPKICVFYVVFCLVSGFPPNGFQDFFLEPHTPWHSTSHPSKKSPGLKPIQRADVFRYLVLYHEGGYYAVAWFSLL